jgi:Flp pilus assembly protein TadG
MMRRRRKSERGSVLVEMAMIVPFLMTLMLAVFELGMMLRSDIVVANANRTAARIGASAGQSTSADYLILTGLGNALSSLHTPTVNYVVIYDVPSASTSTPPTSACTPASPASTFHGITGVCNYYSGANLTTVLAASTVPSTFGCASTDWDKFWCPTSRVITQSSTVGPDYLGVAVSITVPTYTKLFGSSKTFTDHFVMRIEPTANGSTP